MRSILKQLLEIGKIYDLDCGDNSCYFKRQSDGMRTNGGCSCDLPALIQAERDKHEALVKVAREVVVYRHHDPESADSRLEAILKDCQFKCPR